MAKEIPLALYLWTRIRQQGTQSVMGVPGDMNLELLDYIQQVSGLKWVGNANELNAAYAADGYARVMECPGVITTTMGVGELSALNGIGGAYTEQVKVIHVVGTTSTEVQAKRLMIHHCLGPNPDHKVFEKTSKHVRCAHTWLDNSETATAEIDRVIRECQMKSLPVYIYLPMDFVHVQVSTERLQTPIDLSYPVDSLAEDAALKKIVKAVSEAQNPLLLVDCLAARHGASKETRILADLLDIPVFTTSMGKSIIDETHPKFYGVYNGDVSYPGVKLAVESSDCIINIGPLLADSNTGGHTREILPQQVILLEPEKCTVFGEIFAQVYLRPFLGKLLSTFQEAGPRSVELPNLPPQPEPEDADAKSIVQSWLWKRLGSFTRPGDILIAESGTAQFGFPDASLPPSVRYITQVYYGSIGYSVGCCLGAAVAQKEIQAEGGMKDGRTILVVGDGSLQLTVQEVGTMIKLGLNPLVIVINNNGYTIERAIHGPEEVYNDISQWQHQLLLEFFGAKNGRECSRQARTKAELEEVLSLPEYTSPRSIQLLEVFMGVMDIPWRLRSQIAIVNARMEAKKAATKKAKLANEVDNVHANGHKSAPNLAIIGGTGYIGKGILIQAQQALEARRLGSIRILSGQTSRPPGTPEQGEWCAVDYDDVLSIQHALCGVDILISASGMQKSRFSNSKENIITAAHAAGVKVYMPSEFGTDYTRSLYCHTSMFIAKAAHASRARERGMKTVSLFVGLTMERSMLRWIARDAHTWRVVGSPDMTLSVTSEHDIGKFAIEAALLAFINPGLVPDEVRVSSCDITIRDIALLYEKSRGVKITFDVVDLQTAREAWEKRKASIPEGMIGPLIGIMIADGTFDHSQCSSNDVLERNSGAPLQLRSVEEWLAQDTEQPWEGRVLDLD